MTTHHVLRSRWAAIGAAVAVSLGGGGIGISHAVMGDGERTSYVPITPCRLADTRPAPDTIGVRNTPLGSADTLTLDAVGTHGQCMITQGASGLALNVTAIGATQPTFLTIYPAGDALPLASHLNPVPGEPPTPNAVNVNLNADGQFSVFNRFGSVDVIVDVVGYYEDHDHDDRYYTKSEADSQLQLKADTASVYTKGDVDSALLGKADAAELDALASTLAQKADAADVVAELAANTLVPIVTETITYPGIDLTFEQALLLDGFTTTHDGYLVIARSIEFTGLSCGPGVSSVAYLLLDGEPLASSIQTLGADSVGGYVFTGTTTLPTTAGAHQLAIGAECVGVANLGALTANVGGAASVLLIPFTEV